MKTVYILGAGFSVEAGTPTQAELLPAAIALHHENPQLFEERRFTEFKSFLLNQLGHSNQNLGSVEIEDIFTPLDRCLSERSQFRGIDFEKIISVRESIFHVIGRTIQITLDRTDRSKQYIDEFAKFLTDKSSSRANGNYRLSDPVSVISTNWDILLDNSIYSYILNEGYEAVVDYCCYISSRDESDDTIKPGLEKLGQGGFNVKLLKLHGSLNWLQCQRCMRLYAKFHRKIGILEYSRRESCRHCDENFPEEANNHHLASNLIMPTYIKDLSNPQYKIVWQNAGIEISEADELVFIGYSLPNADFEMRQLLSRMVRRKARISVVDCISDPQKKELFEKRWKNFFGDRETTFHFEGASAYINALL